MEELRQRQSAEKSKHGIVATEKRFDQGVDFRRRPQSMARLHDDRRLQSRLEFAGDLRFVNAGVAFDHENHLAPAALLNRPTQASGNRVPALHAGTFAARHGNRGKTVVVRLPLGDHCHELAISAFRRRRCRGRRGNN